MAVVQATDARGQLPLGVLLVGFCGHGGVSCLQDCSPGCRGVHGVEWGCCKRNHNSVFTEDQIRDVLIRGEEGGALHKTSFCALFQNKSLVPSAMGALAMIRWFRMCYSCLVYEINGPCLQVPPPEMVQIVYPGKVDGEACCPVFL